MRWAAPAKKAGLVGAASREARRVLYSASTSLQLGFIEPQLLTSVDQPPQGDEWLHEIKHETET
jgi:hypothetical protein